MTTVTVQPDGVCVPVHKGESILDAVMRSGLSYRFGCRRGGCTECKVLLLSGEVTYHKRIAAQVLTDEERSSGVCLSCRAVPITDVRIRLREGDALNCRSQLMLDIAKAELARWQTDPLEQQQQRKAGGDTKWV
jgi:CDP-4-dehydro-6-deoxyglucose reductase